MSGGNPTRRGVIAGAAAMVAVPAFAKPRDAQVAGYQGLRAGAVQAFKGIRYARAVRFAPPQIEPLTVEKTPATNFAPICPQRGMSDQPQSEDCLFLNIWTPEANPKAARAVMVYFHGGAYTTGSVTDPLTHGQHLAEQGDVVVVTVNHRLNALGYLWLQPLGAQFADSGNLGQLDLICALQWIRHNIHHFGGDSSRVFTFGQSGGGAKIATLMAMPAARGLFHSTATMSGQQVVASGPVHAWERTRAFFDKLKIAQGDVEALRHLPIERFIEGLGAADPIMGGSAYFGPVLDMTNLPRHPFWPDAAPQSLNIPMILGNVIEETRAFLDPRGAKLRGLSWDNIASRMAAEVKIDLDPAYVIAQYRSHHPDWTPEQVYYAATTAGRSWPGQVIEADARAAAGAEKTWVYCLTRRSPVDPLRGAAHTDDIPYVFGTLDALGSFSGTDADARATRDALQGAFVKLAKTGEGSWTPYRLPTRATMLMSENPHVENDPREWERAMWATAPYVQPGS
ncbi:carboxylesterase/lipase family protein [Novosphingobium sediminicola]|uniref:Para-nitrobenzyl esterase n=1 Tax=Novosphingobium sediminicola TaxID=563162 RepID=A0A7W6CQ19_9SPHN|nr:carboxylesterase family protein [Novosphingobium sediminicola]MBB3957830.1 para-nitrobenzyl esterase [Novosphingobium sediminicola]